MAIGDKIRKIRNLVGITQSELGHMVKLTDDRIGHYELNDRKPKSTKLKEIADALGVNVLSISNPDLDTYDGVMHALFYLEDVYGLELIKDGNEIFLHFKGDAYRLNNITRRLGDWYNAKERTAPLLTDTEEIIEQKKKEYDLWRYNYPSSESEHISKKLKENRK